MYTEAMERFRTARTARDFDGARGWLGVARVARYADVRTTPQFAFGDSVLVCGVGPFQGCDGWIVSVGYDSKGVLSALVEINAGLEMDARRKVTFPQSDLSHML